MILFYIQFRSTRYQFNVQRTIVLYCIKKNSRDKSCLSYLQVGISLSNIVFAILKGAFLTVTHKLTIVQYMCYVLDVDNYCCQKEFQPQELNF